MLKRTIIILLVILSFALSMSVCAYGYDIKIDGVFTERAWLDAQTSVVVPAGANSNNAVTFALASFIRDVENHRLYISFKANTDGGIISPDETTAAPPVTGTTEPFRVLHGVRISVDYSDFVAITHYGVGQYDETIYYIDGAVSEYNQGAFGVEVCIGIKLGLDTVESLRVQFVDGNGRLSNAYELSLPAAPEEETTTAQQLFTDGTTAAATTENITTRITTTERTTAEKTTKQERTTAEKTTKPKPAKERTTKSKTTKQRTTVKVVTVYVTEPIKTQTTLNETTVSEASSEQIQQQKLYKELRYAAVAGVLILVFGLCVIINMLNDKNNSDKK